MHRRMGWMAVVPLCVASAQVLSGQGGTAQGGGLDPRLDEARRALARSAELEAQGQYGVAAALAERALALREAALGGRDPTVAEGLQQLGRLRAELGGLQVAESLLLRALAVREAALGEGAPEVAASRDELAALYVSEGRLAEAEPLYRRALSSLEVTLGKEHPAVASSLTHLAGLYGAWGLYRKAEPLLRRALAIREAALGKDHLEVASSLSDLAGLYGARGLYRKAEPLLRRALAIRERALGTRHVALVSTLAPLAHASLEQGKYAQAERLLARALCLVEVALGARHPLAAAVLDELAASYQARGWWDRAEPLRRRAVEIRQGALGEGDPELADALGELAGLRASRGDLAEALVLLRSALEISEWRLRREALGFSASRLDDLLRKLRAQDDRLFSLLRRHPDHPGLLRLALATALLRQGRSVEEAAGLSRAISRGLKDGDRPAYEQLRALRTQLASATSSQVTAELAGQGDALEADLARRSAPLRALRALPLPDQVVESVRWALPPDGALVDLVEYEDRPLVSKPGTPPSRVPRQARYLALVLTPDGRAGAVDLGPAAAIDAAAAGLDRALASATAPYLRRSQALHALAVRPWLPLTGGARRLYVVPDGALATVPFAALHDGRRYVADSRDVAFVTSGRELLPRPEAVPSGHEVVVFADPAVGGSPAGAPAARGSRPRPQCVDPSRASWPPLPGARREAEAVKRFFPEARLRLGADATKAALFELAGPEVLHIAAHGLSETMAGGPGARALVGADPLGVPATECPGDPLLRSGLVMAPPPERAPREGGSIATALELMGLDLWGTELVVLSACESGRGAVERSQGVYGLRRAFLVAGAQTLVTSLWQIDDETTSVLMEEYYRRLGEGRDRVGALREAMLSVRARHPHPHFWAPFIAIGRDGPLRGATRSDGARAGIDEIMKSVQ